MRVTHVRLLVQDMKACVLFYRDTLGFKLIFGDENDVYAEFESGPCVLSLFRQDMMTEVTGLQHLPARAEVQDRGMVFIAVDDVDAAYKELQAKGVQFVVPPTNRPGWGLRTAHFRDPDGNLLELGQDIPMPEVP